MSTLTIGDEEDILAALQETFHNLAGQGDVVLAATLSNACPIPPERQKSVTYTAIGYVENEFDEPTTQGKIRAAEPRIALDPTLWPTLGAYSLPTSPRSKSAFTYQPRPIQYSH